MAHDCLVASGPVPVTSVLGQAEKDQNHCRLGRCSLREVIVGLCFKIVDDTAIHQFPINRSLRLKIQGESSINPSTTTVDDRRELSIYPVVVGLSYGVINTRNTSKGVDVSETKAFFSMLFGDWQDRSLSPGSARRPGPPKSYQMSRKMPFGSSD